MLRKVILYGAMREQFGRSFELDVSSLSEVCRCLGSQLPGFRKAIEDGAFRVTQRVGRTVKKALDETLIDFRLGAGDIHIVPVVAGAKNRGGIGKIILGSLIAAVAFFAGAPQIAFMGLGLAVAGVSSLLTSNKKKRERQTDSNEGGQVATQGGCVPLAYGYCMLEPQCVSAGVTTSDSNGYGIAVGTGQYVSQVGNSSK